MRRASFIGTRWLGVGLAAILAVVTLSLSFTGRLGLYINPDSTWFAVCMSFVVLAGTALSFALPLGAEADHGHDHGEAHPPAAPAASIASAAPEASLALDASLRRRMARTSEHPAEILRHPSHPPTIGHPVALTATVVGGIAASGVVLLTLVLPPASLSAELAMSRDIGAPPLFAGSDAVTLAATGDTASFGVGDWSTVFATATNPDAFDGDAITLTGFVTPGGAADGFDLTRLVITHCVIDAQPASIPIAASTGAPDTGQWVTVTVTVTSTADGRLRVTAESVEAIDEPSDPYEH
ncbi:TIGR03943 family putative permease subunit [Microbacterium pygmaeum]|uniref:TIGR03943 family protein n=1 Tax=Microbacterium pygmaeum TaxID=370764 RepID=A0A1G7UZC8_9MICO|nr:DUF1980 domain-containing protein [Microbacterium pygmaeum]SDG52847.1 TIGR03943 family protein [Microbacterium pygmaeum]